MCYHLEQYLMCYHLEQYLMCYHLRDGRMCNDKKRNENVLAFGRG